MPSAFLPSEKRKNPPSHKARGGLILHRRRKRCSCRKGKYVFGVQGFTIQKFGSHEIKELKIVTEKLERLLISGFGQSFDLFVDYLGRPLRDVVVPQDIPAEENFLLGLSYHDRPDLIAHAEHGDHSSGELGSPLDVVTGAGSDLVSTENDLFSGTSSVEHRQAAQGPDFGVV